MQCFVAVSQNELRYEKFGVIVAVKIDIPVTPYSLIHGHKRFG
jgi:hypothetical protein